MNQYIELICCVTGAIVSVGAAITYMNRAKNQLEKPHKEITKRLDHHDECLARDDQRLKKLEAETDSLREDIRQLMLAIIGMLDDNREKTKEDLLTYLAKRK